VEGNGMKSILLPDGRGWVAIASFVLVLIVLMMIKLDPTLKQDDFFKTIATLLIGTAWVNGPVAWAFQATKTGGELADRNAAIVEKQANSNPPINKEPSE
jgi:hypothetical protein